jgi:hypothetical protein
MASRYGSTIGIEESDLAGLRKLIESFDYNTLRRNVLERRKQILMSTHTKRLLRFCQKIQASGVDKPARHA